MNELQSYKEKYESLACKKNLEGEAALAAVKENSDALQYVSEQKIYLKPITGEMVVPISTEPAAVFPK